MKNASTSISDTQPREEDAEPAQFFDKITLHALRRLAGFTAQRHKRRKRYGWWVVAYQNHRMGRSTSTAPSSLRDHAADSGQLNAGGEERR